ncbi:MAG: GatB/YqeY domain-containing protein [Hyphomicrobiaceae bacterium]|nr:GatB/YqeY domain-containing protein [Hyphomicrobiaceae bacterium]
MRSRISSDLKTAMKAGDKEKVAVLRLINAAIQSAEIEAKGTIDEAGVLAVMTKMVKQRRDSIQQYTDGGRVDLADKEQAEIAIIEQYLPKQMDEAAVAEAVKAAIAETGAASPKDMGKVMGVLKGKYAGQMDFQKASAAVKSALAG